MKLLDSMPELTGLPQAHQKGLFSERNLHPQKVSVFYFWSSDCAFCKRWPQFIEQVEQLYGDKVQCIVVHVGSIQSADVPNVKVANLIDINKELSDKFQVRFFPAIYIFDQERKLRYRQAGSSETRMLVKRIEKFLER